MQILSISRPDDWHVHFRDHDKLPHTVLATATHFARALVMPNLIPALTTIPSINTYRQRILASLPEQSNFTPYMTLFLNSEVTPDRLQDIKNYPYILGAKLYPADATTNSTEGVRTIKDLYPLLQTMQENDLVLQVHGESRQGDIFAREALFLENDLKPLIKAFPKLRIVLEHISTRAAVDFVMQTPETIAATITPHHLLYNRNDLLVNGIKPHYYCLPILKQQRDQKALQQAATSGNAKFFAGTDSAPHTKATKESACGCAGVFSAPFAVAMYAELFDQCDQLDKLDAFLGKFGAAFYQLPLSQERLELVKKDQKIPDQLPFGDDIVVPLAAGSTLKWRAHEPT